MTAPDWPELRRIGAEATRLADATHRLLPADYERLLARAKVAVAGHGYLLEFIINRNPNPPPSK